jgi:general secretion pathway protein G
VRWLDTAFASAARRAAFFAGEKARQAAPSKSSVEPPHSMTEIFETFLARGTSRHSRYGGAIVSHTMPRSSSRSHASLRRGFTLLEIMIALAILGLLVGLGISNVGNIFGDAQQRTASLFVNEAIKLPLTSYRMHMGDYPSTAEGLRALVAAPANRADQWHGPYLADGKLPNDPWGDAYVYKYPGTHNKNSYDIFSKGPDHTEGTKDDIGNWTEEKQP